MVLAAAAAAAAAAATSAKERNALSVATLEEIEAALRAVEEDRTLRAVVLRAEGPVFSAGHNVKEMVRGRTAPARDEGDYFRHCFGLCSRVMQTIRRLRAPVIAQVDGLATAAGAQVLPFTNACQMDMFL